jgi:hypothetical protein
VFKLLLERGVRASEVGLQVECMQGGRSGYDVRHVFPLRNPRGVPPNSGRYHGCMACRDGHNGSRSKAEEFTIIHSPSLLSSPVTNSLQLLTAWELHAARRLPPGCSASATTAKSSPPAPGHNHVSLNHNFTNFSCLVFTKTCH